MPKLQHIFHIVGLAPVLLAAQGSWAQTYPPSYTPSWQARHAIVLLVDQAGLSLTTSQWPLPGAAVHAAVSQLPGQLPEHLQAMQRQVLADLARAAGGHVAVHPRAQAEALGGYGVNYTPGSSAQVVSPSFALGGATVQLGVRAEASPNSLQTQFSGHGTEGRTQLKLHNTSATLPIGPVQLQAFSQQHWWGVGWQSSLLLGHNAPALTGLGVQRQQVQASSHPWLAWLGPWSAQAFVAQVQDPVVVATGQPTGYIFTGMRFTARPTPWLEVAASRGIQFGGQGRSSDLSSYIKSLLGQQVNQNPGDPPDVSSQIAGFDVRASCPTSMGCAVYGQLMGEDEAGYLPYKFMSLFGYEQTLHHGRTRLYVEYSSTFNDSLKRRGNTQPGLVNSQYPQAFTHGARWLGPAQGAGAQLWTLGWLDHQSQRMVKLHSGSVRRNYSVGAYDPRVGVNAPHGNLLGLSLSQTFDTGSWSITPELDWLRLSQGTNQRAQKTNHVRLGVAARLSLQ